MSRTDSAESQPARATPASGVDATPRNPRDPVVDRARESVRARLFEQPSTPVMVGRFALREKIGEGGMGVVFTAHDAELDREVAIKLLHTDDDTRSRRLLREAKAMARLTHPNVVTVYEAGTDKGQVYLAMELVKGDDLRRWLDREPRSWRRVLPLLVDAAQGLAAAHDAGLVHRDFKPENVLVGADGRAKVADFGLARAADASSLEASGDASETTVSLHTLTRSGAIVGTPAYLPPEVLDGGTPDARGDQFSFCVTAYEALVGRRPFAGRTLTELLDNVRHGRIRGGRSARAIPRVLRRAIVRGLASSPEARHGSMRDLVRAFEAQLARRRRIALGVGASGSALALAVAFGWPSPESKCTGAGQAWSEAWTDQRREAVAAALLATEHPGAQETADRVGQAIDAYGERWIATHREACLATVRGERSTKVLDDAIACLEGRRAHVDVLAETLLAIDREGVSRAMPAVQRLPEIDVCLSTDEARRGAPLPEDPELRRQVQELQAQLARAHVEADFGAMDKAHALFRELQDTADALGFRPTMADVRLAQLEPSAATAEDRDLIYDALYHALASDYADAQRRAWIVLTRVHAYLGEYDASERAARHAQALIEQMGEDARTSAMLLEARAFSKLEQSKFEEALELMLASVEMIEANDPHDPRLDRSLNSLGTIYTLLERNEDALRAYERAYDLAIANYGAHHEHVAKAMFDLGRVEARLDDLEASNRWYEQAIALYDEVGAADSIAAIFARGNLGQNYGDQGQYTEAIATTERAIAALVRKVGPSHRYLVRMRRGLAEIYLDAGEGDKAIAEGAHALEIAEATFGDEHDETASTRRRMAQILFETGDRERAIPLFERALQGHSAPETPPLHKAISQYWLIVALRDDPAQRDRVRALAEEAIGPLSEGEARDRERADELRAWLAAHPG